ncbi:MAG: hypothetical protein H0X24_19975 [Ktedonobacterales bacterium]|nr:hypothetical protein [Ktedonobacterales bacterium]
MDSPVWSNDILYLKEMIATISVTIAITIGCFYLSRRADRKRADRLAHGLPAAKRPYATRPPERTHD